jgi:hypothetical protein
MKRTVAMMGANGSAANHENGTTTNQAMIDRIAMEPRHAAAKIPHNAIATTNA